MLNSKTFDIGNNQNIFSENVFIIKFIVFSKLENVIDSEIRLTRP